MQTARRILALALAVAFVLPASTAFALPALQSLSQLGGRAQSAQGVPEPKDVRLIDKPGDDGSALILTFTLDSDAPLYVLPQVEADHKWAKTTPAPLPLAEVKHVSDMPEVFGMWPSNPNDRVVVIDSYIPAPKDAPGLPPAGGAKGAAADRAAAAKPGTVSETGSTSAESAPAQAEAKPLAAATAYHVQLTITSATGTRNVDAGTATPIENHYSAQKTNVLLISIIFAAIILGAIAMARANPHRLFIRRIAGLEAVDEAIGRATEMGKPVMQINGLDPLSSLGTIAAVNMLGRIARRVAHYDSRLMVPSTDPVVMTVSQETVKQAYLEEGRPDAYREDDIFFVTDQQFSYVASVCGLMLREKPAAILLLGVFYAESLMLAETGASTGAIQIAGTDAQAQLPFFITACDYTLIGEELYAASAYLSREPMLLGSLKGQDVGKAIIMLLILFGSILATFGHDILTKLFTVLN